MKVKVDEVKTMMTSVLKGKGYSDEDIPFLIDMYLIGEMRGHRSHGLSSFVSFAQSEPETTEEPVVVKQTHALVAYDAKGANGNVFGKRAADDAMRLAKAEGMDKIGHNFIRTRILQ